MIRKRHFEVVLKDTQGWEKVVDERPTLRGAQSSACEWQFLIARAGQCGKETVEIREADHED